MHTADFSELEKLETATPIRALLHHVPNLALCKDSNCKGDCQKFHLDIEEHAEELLLYYWTFGPDSLPVLRGAGSHLQRQASFRHWCTSLHLLYCALSSKALGAPI